LLANLETMINFHKEVNQRVKLQYSRSGCYV
jgi:hypothetical protein